MANIKTIAEKLAAIVPNEALPEIIRILREEYGIDLVVVLTEGLEDDHHFPKEEIKNLLSEMQKRTLIVNSVPDQPKSKPFVPRKVGKPCGFPRYMRRRK